jgi:hypothetical protein
MSDAAMIQELRKKRDALLAERAMLEERLAAINTVIDMFEGGHKERGQEPLTLGVSENESSPEVAESSNGHSKKISITQEVREAVREYEGEFKTQDIVKIIKAKHPETEISPTPVSTALGRMVRRDEGIRVVREGEGWEPNIYERVVSNDPVQESSVSG